MLRKVSAVTRFDRFRLSRLGALALPCCLVWLFLLATAGSASAQITAQTGAVRVVVLDPNGGTVSGARVTLSSPLAVPVSKETVEDGSVVFPLVTPGSYKVEVEQSSFRRAVVTNVQVNITDITNLRVVLELGQVTTEVSVSADVAQTVNTTNATLGNVITGDVIHDLPLATRNFAFALALSAGTASALPDSTLAGRGTPVVFVNGQRGTNNNLVINGTDANSLGSNNFSTVPIPSPDSLEEFRVQTSLYDASQGKTSGGNINVITRSGTDVYHGEAFEFLRNDAFNANQFFFNRNGSPRPVLKQNQFGGNFGGRVPKVQDTFFFGSYQGTRQINGVASSITAGFPLLPATRDAASLQAAYQLPAGSVSPVSVGFLNLPGQFGGKLFPSGGTCPPAPATCVDSQGNPLFGSISISKPLRFNEDQFNANVDHNFGLKSRVYVKFFFANNSTIDPLGGEGAGGLGSGQTTPQKNRLLTLGWTYTATSNLVNEMHFGFNRVTQVVKAVDPATVDQIGMSRFNSSAFAGIPLFLTGDIVPVFGGISTNNDQASFSNTFHYADTLAWTHGKHTFRGGFEYRRYQINLFNNFASRGFLFFSTFDDLLTGNILQAFVGTGITDRGFRARDAAGYFQDDWKVTKRLTLNLGVRYDYLGPSTDVKDRLGNFDPSRLDALTRANGGPGLLNGFVLPAGANFGAIKGTPGVDDSTLLNNDHNNWAPRIGFAWDVQGNGKTSVRGGYGLYYIRISNQTLLQLITAVPFFQLSSVVAPGTPLNNPFPNLPVPSQFPIFPTAPHFTGFSAAGSPTFSGPLLSVNPFERGLRTPYVGSWNLTVQRELPWKINVEAGYIGSQGVKLLDGRQVNQARLANPDNPITVGGANGVPQTVLTTVSSRDNNARVPVLGFSSTGLNEVTEAGHSTYHAGILTVNRRTSRMFLQGAYTYSKSIDNNSGSLLGTQDLGNSGGNNADTSTVRALSNFDRTHRLQVTYEYFIPGFASGALHHALGNWSVGGLTTFQSGLPNTIFCGAICSSTNVFGFSNTAIFPNLIGDIKGALKSGDPQQFTGPSSANGVFNLGSFGAPTTNPAGTSVSGLNTLGGPGSESFTIGGPGTGSHVGQFFGTLGRNVIRGPRQQQWDFFLAKKFPIHERLALQFRSEFFNVFNHPNFKMTNLTVGSPVFGVYDTQDGSSRVIQLALKLQF
jgi:hypothetical protein